METYLVASKVPSSSDHLRVWEPVPRAPFREPQSLLQVVAGVGQGVGWKLGLKVTGTGSAGGPQGLAPYRELGEDSFEVTVASQLPGCHI